MADDVNEIEMINGQAEADNARVVPVLQLAADCAVGPQERRRGGLERLVVRQAGLQLPVAAPGHRRPGRHAVQSPPPYITTCFVAGTPVRTLDGPRPIEAIQVGDQVLSQDAVTGAWASSPSSSSITTRPARPCGSRSPTASRWFAASITGSGGPTSAGPWPGSSSPAMPSAPSAAWSGSPRSSPIDPAPLQSRRRRAPHLLRRRGRRAGPRQHAARSPAQAVRCPARRGGDAPSGVSRMPESPASGAAVGVGTSLSLGSRADWAHLARGGTYRC